MIPYGRQSIDAADIEAVVEVLRSDFLTQGPAVPAFEKAIADYCGAPHALAFNSATSALHAGCLALGLGPGDRLWTSPNTFVASANAARYCGADVDFVDVELATGNMSVAALEQKLASAAAAGKLPKIVIPVHFSGYACDMPSIGRLAARYGFRVIEDASHAIGARHAGGRVGDCKDSDIAVFSFHPVKIVTTGEGGATTTRDPDLARRLALFRSHGTTRDPAQMTHASDGGWYYQQIELGFNYRITDIQAALGRSQLARIEALLARRRALVKRYRVLLRDLPMELPDTRADEWSAWHLFVIRLTGRHASRRREVYDALRAAGIGVNVHYIPVHLQPYYRELGFQDGNFPQAEQHYASALTLPLFPGLTDAAQDTVAGALRAALG
ncbi:MAG: UDP-4-amino-4,6-dideoxy-N-acetyl-beta-L-altrosamine transaminase [Candidatus Parcubacteria bacterium]|nr:UDP-4-amino-4,6-dideoxy-N-acetyl-beta-L-altrosamine transaminase [Burkholderiales bacterium]